MLYQDLLQHSILELVELNELIVSAQNECECEQNSETRCIPCYDREKIVFHHMKLVRKICKEFSQNTTLAVDEFMADGLIGLHKAIDKFDLEQSNKFFHFASNSIRWEVMAGDLYSPLIIIPWPTRKKIRKLLKKIDEYEARNEVYTYEQMCKDLKVSKTRLAELLYLSKSKQKVKVSDEDPLKEESYDHNAEKYHYDNEDWINSSDLKPALESLSDYERKIIVSYYGIEGEEKTLGELSKEFNQSYEYTRRGYHQALESLRCYFRLEIQQRENE